MKHDKRVVWLGSSLHAVRCFPAEARAEAGHQLRRVQMGLMPGDWKPVKVIGPGVAEIRIDTALEHRIVFLARFEEAIYVLHAFEKRTIRIRKADLALARRRLAELEAIRHRFRES